MATWNPRANDVFLDALEILDPVARTAFVDEACRGEPELRQQVQALLDASEQAGNFLDQPAVTPVQTDGYEPRSEPETTLGEGEGTRIGPYKLLQQIGEGGMGTVYMAEQTHPVRRHVALKVIKPGMDSQQVVARFEAERQALAMMDHVNIARVFDGGTTNTGRPYFVMELVRGVPITKYCDDNNLTPRQRLELFVPVCQAIQHAHQKGIIHRDIKPNNVMVTLYDGRPVPKVIDFGIAKATEQKLTDRTLFTQFGGVIGTLEYMSPEQAEMSALGVDTRSDIYSLGVLLYELLTGSTPLDHDRMKEAAFAEILRRIKEEEPPRPSSRLSDSGEALASISARRQMEPAKLARLVRGELDWIVMKTLEKDRGRRYDTANAFAADIQRYLADETVLACPPSAAYRLRKFARRNKWPLVAGLVCSLALFGGVIGATYGLLEAQKQREVTSLWQQAEGARAEAVTARDGEAIARGEAEKARERMEAVEYGRTMQMAHQAWRDNKVPTTLAMLDNTRVHLRGWEWRYVHRLCNSDLLTLKDEAKHFSSACFSLDGLSILMGSDDGTVQVRDARTGKLILTLTGHTKSVTAASYSSDGLRIVTASSDMTACVWDARTGKRLQVLQTQAHAIRSASFSPDGSRVLTGLYNSMARVWDVATGTAGVTIKLAPRTLTTATYSPDGTRIITASPDGIARLWNATTGAEELTLKGHTGIVWSAMFSPDGSRIVTASQDRTARVWDAKTGAELRTLTGHTAGLESASYSLDGSRIVTASRDRTARVWNATTGIELLTLKGHTLIVQSASFSPDGTQVVTSGDGTVKVWNALTGIETLTLTGRDSAIWTAAFSPDGTRAVTGNVESLATVWDTRTGNPILTLKGHTMAILSVAYSADGLRLVTASRDQSARIWDAKSGAELLTLTGHAANVFSASFSPDGSRILTASEDRTARLWDAKTGAKLRTLTGHTANVMSASFSPDGSRILTASADETARVWDARTGAVLLTLTGHSRSVHSAKYSLDGSRIVTASADETARVWDAKTGAELRTLTGHTHRVQSAAFSPDGSRIVTASGDNTARVWDARSGAELLTLTGHTNMLWSASFSADGSRILTASSDGTARVWDATPLR